MINRKKINIFMSLVLLLSLLVFNCSFSPEAQAAEAPVQLCYTNFHIASGTMAPSLEFYYDGCVSISNAEGNKNVTVHYSTDQGKTWKDVKAEYYKTNSDKTQIWYFRTLNAKSSSIEFSIKYGVDGKTYEDNNGGKDYKTDWSSILAKSDLCVTDINSGTATEDGAVCGPRSTSFSIILKNLGNLKNVKVRYTTDNWTTYKDINANYSQQLRDNSFEAWSASIENISLDTKQLQFAVCYEVNGVEYWDNNFGSNYVVNY